MCTRCYESEVLGIHHSSSDEQEDINDVDSNKDVINKYCDECQTQFFSDKDISICQDCLERKRVKLLEEHTNEGEKGKDKIIKIGCPDCRRTFKIPVELDYSKKKSFIYPFCPKCN